MGNPVGMFRGNFWGDLSEFDINGKSLRPVCNRIWVPLDPALEEQPYAMDSPIPIRHRRRLPRRLSYPLGATVLANALTSVPQFAKLSVTFTWLRADRIPLRAQPITVLQAEYHKDDNSKLYTAPLFRDISWGLSVHAVKCSDSARVRRLLQCEGLSAVRAWLCAPRTETWLARSRWFTVRFNGEVLLYEETP